MKKFTIFALASIFSVVSAMAAFAAQVVDLGKPETLSQYGAVQQAPGSNNGLIFMAHQDVVFVAFPEALKKIDHEGGSALSVADLPLEILRGREVTIWYSQEVTPKGFVEKKTSPTPTPDPDPTMPTSDDIPAPAQPESGDVSGPEVSSLEGLEKVGQVRERTNSVWKDFAPTSDGRFGGELVALRVTGYKVTEVVDTFVTGGSYVVATADVLENQDGSATRTISGLRALSAPGNPDAPKSGQYEDGNLWVVIALPGVTRFFFEGSNVLKVDGGESLLSDPNGRCVYRADGGEIGTITIFLSSELADPTDNGEGGSGGGGGCDSGMGLPALLAVVLFLKRKSR